MKQKLKAIFKGPTVFYPLLFAAFPILFLYAYNISETSASQMWLPLGVSVAGALVLWTVLSLIFRSLTKAGIATAIFLLFFFSYGRIYDALETWGMFVPKHAYLLPVILFIWSYCVYFIGRTKRDFRVTTKVLNIIAVALIAINLFSIANYEIKLARLSDITPKESPQETTGNSTDLSTLPDIYFIILDEYANPDTMKEWYDYDNSGFVKSLEDEGFFVAIDSKTRVPCTPLAITQVLNMEYLTGNWYWDDINKDYAVDYVSDYGWNDLTYRELAYSKVADFLKAQGYEYIALGHSTPWENYMKENTDLYINYFETAATPWISEFQKTLWNTTMLRPFYLHIFGGQYETANRRQVLYTLEHLKSVPEMEGLKFVFAYFKCPHEPFVFGPSGEHIAAKDYQNFKDKQFYRGQYIFISTQIEKLVDALLEKSEIPPIIILQSDHGVRIGLPGIEIGCEEWKRILNVMYLPGMDYSELSDSISPVNTFRLIFNHYFGADYMLLEDD